MSKRIVTEVAEDVEKAKVCDGSVALHGRHNVAGVALTSRRRRRICHPREEAVDGRTATGQPMEARIKRLIQQVLRQQRLRLQTTISE